MRAPAFWHAGCDESGMATGGSVRSRRTCVRCGRSGSNAFEPVPDVVTGRSAWACTHLEPCAVRQRTQWRAGQRDGSRRPRSSPLLAWSDEGQRACVISGDPEAASNIEHLLRELTPFEVERLDLSPRSMTRLSRGNYCVVILDTRPSDPLAYCNEVQRRLGSVSRRQLPVVIASPPNQPLRPPVRDLAARPNARVVERPVIGDALVAAVSDAMRASGSQSRLSA